MNDILEYKGYYGNVHFSAEDETFIGEVIGINDTIVFEGETVEELKASFFESVEDYLDACREVGKDPDKTYKGSFNIRISTDLHRDAAMLAAIKKISLNDFVRYAINEVVAKEKKQLSV